MERPATPGWSTRDLVLLLALLLLGGMVKGVIWQRTAILARDGIGFIEIAQRFDREPWPQVLREAHQHPVYPVHVWLTARAASWIGMPPQSNLDWQQCAHAANVFLGVLVVIPMYVLARPLVGVWGAFAAAFLYQVLPVPAHVTADTLSEGAYLFWAATGLALLTRGLQVWRWYWFILAGLAVGLAYLTRPEGAMITLAGLAVLFWAALRRWQPQPWRRAVLAGLCLGLATAATVTPYWLTIGRLGSKNTFNQMLQAAAPSPAANTTATTLLLATRFQPGVDGFDWDDVTPWFVAAVVVKEIGKGAHYLPAIIALVGLAWFWRRSTKHDDERAAGVLLSALLALNVAVLYWLGYRAHYVSERHTVLIT
ncbi:MAG TPA: glycosyltransferase family 39 protein, partial [Gemmatales bacterium]|nr:glycosyltransferase family 39 protein [Gemmatales bacterium]